MFRGEDGLEGGAVRSKYSHLLLEEVSNRLFKGNPTNFVPVEDSAKLVLFHLAEILVVHVIV